MKCSIQSCVRGCLYTCMWCVGWSANGMDWVHMGQTSLPKPKDVFGLVWSHCMHYNASTWIYNNCRSRLLYWLSANCMLYISGAKLGVSRTRWTCTLHQVEWNHSLMCMHRELETFKSCCVVGIQPWEDKYEEMAKAMGIDPSVSTCTSNVLLVVDSVAYHL